MIYYNLEKFGGPDKKVERAAFGPRALVCQCLVYRDMRALHKKKMLKKMTSLRDRDSEGESMLIMFLSLLRIAVLRILHFNAILMKACDC